MQTSWPDRHWMHANFNLNNIVQMKSGTVSSVYYVYLRMSGIKFANSSSILTLVSTTWKIEIVFIFSVSSMYFAISLLLIIFEWKAFWKDFFLKNESWLVIGNKLRCSKQIPSNMYSMKFNSSQHTINDRKNTYTISERMWIKAAWRFFMQLLFFSFKWG